LLPVVPSGSGRVQSWLTQECAIRCQRCALVEFPIGGHLTVFS
jgi:hypothetical protein